MTPCSVASSLLSPLFYLSARDQVIQVKYINIVTSADVCLSCNFISPLLFYLSAIFNIVNQICHHCQHCQHCQHTCYQHHQLLSDSLAVSSRPPLLPVCTESSRQRRDRQRKLHNIRSADLNTQSNPVDIGRRCRRYSNTDTQSQSQTLTHTDAEKERQKTNTRRHRHTTQTPKTSEQLLSAYFCQDLCEQPPTSGFFA